MIDEGDSARDFPLSARTAPSGRWRCIGDGLSSWCFSATSADFLALSMHRGCGARGGSSKPRAPRCFSSHVRSCLASLSTWVTHRSGGPSFRTYPGTRTESTVSVRQASPVHGFRPALCSHRLARCLSGRPWWSRWQRPPAGSAYQSGAESSRRRWGSRSALAPCRRRKPLRWRGLIFAGRQHQESSPRDVLHIHLCSSGRSPGTLDAPPDVSL